MMERCCHGDECCHRYKVKECRGAFHDNKIQQMFMETLHEFQNSPRDSHSFKIQILTTPWKGGGLGVLQNADNAQVPQSDLMCPARKGGRGGATKSSL